MALNFFQRDQLDKELSGPFKRGDIIADNKGEIIGTFDNVAYHGGNPEYPIGNDIFADFFQAISKQGRKDWCVFKNGCGDDDVYIDSRKHDLSFHYRFATEAEKELFRTFMRKDKDE